jgi:hypothetical protein
MSHQSMNPRHNLATASLLIVLAVGTLGLTGCVPAMVVPAVAVDRWAQELADDLTQSIITSSSLYQLAVQRAQESEAAVAVLGYPLQGGRVGSASEYNFEAPGYGRANFSFRISGPKGTGRMHLVANLRGAASRTWIRTESGGFVMVPDYKGSDWEFEALELTVDGSSLDIDLLDGAK